MELFDLNLAVCNQCIFSYHLMKFETTAKEITATVSYYKKNARVEIQNETRPCETRSCARIIKFTVE